MQFMILAMLLFLIEFKNKGFPSWSNVIVFSSLRANSMQDHARRQPLWRSSSALAIRRLQAFLFPRWDWMPLNFPLGRGLKDVPDRMFELLFWRVTSDKLFVNS
jgi:hypothetical protein